MTAEFLLEQHGKRPHRSGRHVALVGWDCIGTCQLHDAALHAIRPLPAHKARSKSANWPPPPSGKAWLSGANTSCPSSTWPVRPFSQCARADALQNMSWQQFETLVGEGFQRRGGRVKETGGGRPDGGVDLVLSKDGEKTLVQCKQWKAFKVGVSTVRELYGVMAADGAAAGFVVTSGRFTQEAVAFAAGRNIHLMDGAALMKLLKEAKAQTDATSATKARTSVPLANPVPVAELRQDGAYF